MLDMAEENLNLPASKLPQAQEPDDFRSSLHWRVLRILSEFIDGWQFLADFKKTVTIFGKAMMKNTQVSAIKRRVH